MSSKSKLPPVVSEEAIRERAYHLWEADGRPDGRGDHYWQLAHAEATEALVAGMAEGVAKSKKGRNPLEDSPTATSASAKPDKAAKKAMKAVKAAGKAAAKKAPKPRAAVPGK